jgi:hypothetical protein
MGIDALGQPVIGGTTSSSDFPVTPGAPDPTSFGSSEAFVTRLDLLPVGAVRFGVPTSGCTGPPALGVTSIPAVGNGAFAVMGWNAPPSVTGVLAFSPAPLVIPLAFGPLQVWVDIAAPGFELFYLASNGQGVTVLPAPLPANPALAGLQGYLQMAWPDACVAGGLSATHGLAIVIQP